MISALSWVVTMIVSFAASLTLSARAPQGDTSALAAAVAQADEQFCQAVIDRNV